MSTASTPQQIKTDWIEGAWGAGRAVQATIEIRHEPDGNPATQTITLAPIGPGGSLYLYAWIGTGLGYILSYEPVDIISHGPDQIDYQTDEDTTVTLRSVPIPTDRWGREYRPWDLPSGDHVLLYTDGETETGAFSASTAREIARKAPDHVEVIKYKLASMECEGHAGTCERLRQEADQWQYVDCVMIVASPKLTEEILADDEDDD